MNDRSNDSQVISWASPMLWGNEREYLLEALASTWISGGPFVRRFEHDFREIVGSRHALAVSNGTTALHLAYLGAKLQPGDEVIVPGFCFLAAANVALHMGAKPVFADVDPSTWCVTAEALERVRTSRTRIAVPVHTYGNVCEMDTIVDWGREHSVTIIEDAAEAFASRFKGRHAGTFGDFGTYSFQATKTITTGEGGMVVTGDGGAAKQMALFRSHGTEAGRYWHEVPGHNFRLTNLQAALGVAQLERLSEILASRARLHAKYRECLSGEPGMTLQRFTDDVDPALWATALQVDSEAFPQGRDVLLGQLEQAGIECRPGFNAPSQMPIYSTPPLPISEVLSRTILSVPTHPAVTDAQVEYICSTLLRLRR